MSTHLDDQETALAAAGFPLETHRLAHLDSCVACRRSVTHFHDLVETRRLEMEEEMPEWEAHRERVLNGLPDPATPSRRRWTAPLLAAAATITLAVGTAMLVHRPNPGPMQAPRPEIAVEEILAQTESLLAEDGIPDFAVLDDLTDDDLTKLFDSLNS